MAMLAKARKKSQKNSNVPSKLRTSFTGFGIVHSSNYIAVLESILMLFIPMGMPMKSILFLKNSNFWWCIQTVLSESVQIKFPCPSWNWMIINADHEVVRSITFGMSWVHYVLPLVWGDIQTEHIFFWISFLRCFKISVGIDKTWI